MTAVESKEMLISMGMNEAELAAKNQLEKIEKVIESVEQLPDSFSKEKLKNAILEGNFGAIFSLRIEFQSFRQSCLPFS